MGENIGGVSRENILSGLGTVVEAFGGLASLIKGCEGAIEENKQLANGRLDELEMKVENLETDVNEVKRCKESRQKARSGEQEPQTEVLRFLEEIKRSNEEIKRLIYSSLSATHPDISGAAEDLEQERKMSKQQTTSEEKCQIKPIASSPESEFEVTDEMSLKAHQTVPIFMETYQSGSYTTLKETLQSFMTLPEDKRNLLLQSCLEQPQFMQKVLEMCLMSTDTDAVLFFLILSGQKEALLELLEGMQGDLRTNGLKKISLLSQLADVSKSMPSLSTKPVSHQAT